MPSAPTVQDYHRTMESALGARLEGIHELQHGIVLANRDKRGTWGRVNAYYAYCHRCRRWFDFEEACSHTECSGQHWDQRIGKAEWQWWPELQKIGDRVQRGEHPYFDGVRDRRKCAARPGSDIAELLLGERQLLLGAPSEGLSAPLEVLVDVPLPESRDIAAPLKVLLYFHGHGGETCKTAPRSRPGCAVVAAECPKFVHEETRCFWFLEGDAGAWDRHEHAKLKCCRPMLDAVANVVDSVLLQLSELYVDRGVDAEIYLFGVSMGASAVLEFTRSFPSRVKAAVVVAGYYNVEQLEDLASAIAEIPLLLVHSREDHACPFSNVERLHQLRLASGKASETEAWFSEGSQHCPPEEDLLVAIEWLLQRENRP
eukprot:TRINITY_DN40495_c0_g1_i1.p1 TRINITY_DN40495_c0_g1~~TRINITY_DN40495_c0_g1_i1.p1  ORF type:complete len:372 (-),score=67.45 TRINITY_DN40495_c0_g1_i1:59-1174(-)